MRQRARRQIDRRLADLRPDHRFQPPFKGWIRAIRDALGMSGPQLGARLGVRPQTIDALEKSEVAGSIQLGTLRWAAAALDCTLVYALVPNGSLDETVKSRARRIAMRDLAQAAHSTKLEGQQTDDTDEEERIEAYIHTINDRDLWKET